MQATASMRDRVLVSQAIPVRQCAAASLGPVDVTGTSFRAVGELRSSRALQLGVDCSSLLSVM